MRKKIACSGGKKKSKTSIKIKNGVSNLPDTEFKTMIIKTLKKSSENFNREIASIQKVHRNHKKRTSLK